MSHTLQPFSQQTLSSTKAQWQAESLASAALFHGDIARLFTFAEANFDVQNAPGNDHVYGIFENGNFGVADSVVQMSVTKEGRKFVKMLDCVVRPSIADGVLQYTQEAIDKTVGIYIASIVGTVRVAGDHEADVIKVYGRTEPLLATLSFVAKELASDEAKPFVEAAIQGRWLVVKPK